MKQSGLPHGLRCAAGYRAEKYLWYGEVSHFSSQVIRRRVRQGIFRVTQIWTVLQFDLKVHM